MIRKSLWPVGLGVFVLACGRDRARDAAISNDTLGTPGPAAATPATPPTGDTTRRDSSRAAVPSGGESTGTGGTPSRPPASVAEKPAAPPTPDKPTGKPNIHPQSPREPVQIPRPAAPPQDTGRRAAVADTPPLRDPYHQAPRDTVSQVVYNGWKQFNLNCARCHGEDVLGTTIAPHLILSLKPDGPINTKELFIQTVCHGRPEKGMPAWCSLGLDNEKIEQIYSYVKGRSDGKIGPGRPAVRQ